MASAKQKHVDEVGYFECLSSFESEGGRKPFKNYVFSKGLLPERLRVE